MNRFLKPIELVANVLIIVVAVLCLGAVAQKYLRPAQPAPPGVKIPSVGDRISSLDINWSTHSKNVLLVLQAGCHYCTESADFYRTLVQQAKGKDVSVTAVLPQSSEEAGKYMNKLQLSDIAVKQSSLDALDVSGTPTVILADEKGRITNVWVGKLPSNQQKDVLASLLE